MAHRWFVLAGKNVLASWDIVHELFSLGPPWKVLPSLRARLPQSRRRRVAWRMARRMARASRLLAREATSN